MSDAPAPASVTDPALFRTLFATAPDAMVVVNQNGVIVLANPQAAHLFGYVDGDLVGQHVEMLLPAAVREAHVAHRDRYMAQPRVRPMGAGYELTGLRADGSHFPVEVGLSPVGNDGQTLFAASVRDISETQRARQALIRARYDACVAQISRHLLATAHYEQVVAGLPELVAETLDITAVAIVVADEVRAGQQERASVGLSGILLDTLLGNEDLQALVSELMSREPEIGETRLIDRFYAACPEFVDSHFADVALAPLSDRQAPMGFLAAFARERGHFDRDQRHFLQSVTNMLAAAIQRGRSEEALVHAQRLEALGQLTGGIAHDFNNLLTVISGNLQLLETELVAHPDTLETIGRASRAVDRGAALTSKLLAFSRRQHLIPREIRVDRLLSDLHGMLTHTLGERITIDIEYPDHEAVVYADPGELEAALLNLALNARDAMPRGGVLSIGAWLRQVDADELVNAETSTPGAYVVFSVVDSGSGMSPEVLARAFEPFFTTKDSGKGSGLGLSRVYGFARQSGGQLRIGSQLGYGTHADLYLPAVQAAHAEPQHAPVSSEPSRGRGIVLVVEDEVEVRRIAVAFLESLGYDTLEAGDSASALTLLTQHPEIDVLFSDIVLGNEMTGFELALHARSQRPSLPLLFTSGYEQVSDDVDTGSLGAFEILRKPYRRDQLAEAMQRALERAHVRAGRGE